MYPVRHTLPSSPGGRKTIEVVVLVVTAVVLVILLLLLRRQRGLDPPPVAEVVTGSRTCPLCGEKLGSDEKVKSVLYPAAKGAPDRMMEIYGCPHCYPEGTPRRCPVCKKELKPDSVVIARCFQKPGKTHVHVLGCTDCYRKN